MTQAKTPLLSDAEHKVLAEALVNAKTDGDRIQIMNRIEKLADEGALDEAKLMQFVKEAQSKPAPKASSQPQSQSRPTQPSSSSPSSGGGRSNPTSAPSSAGASDRNGASDRSKDKTLVFSFRFIRGLVLVTNVAPYRIILTSLLPRTAIAEVYAWLFKMPILGVIGMTLAGYLLWYALQSMETAKGAGLWPVRAIAYVVDAFLCFATFPPLIGGISALGLFVFAGTFSDVDWPNFAICVFAIGAWEALNYIERKVFKGCDFGFWGVKIR